jgi:hypothetical protein
MAVADGHQIQRLNILLADPYFEKAYRGDELELEDFLVAWAEGVKTYRQYFWALDVVHHAHQENKPFGIMKQLVREKIADMANEH